MRKTFVELLIVGLFITATVTVIFLLIKNPCKLNEPSNNSISESAKKTVRIPPHAPSSDNPDAKIDKTGEILEEIQKKTSDIYEKSGVTYLLLEETEIILVNKVYSLPKDFGAPNDEANNALQKMIDTASKDGISLFLVSGYRSFDTQDGIYSKYLAEWGQEYTDSVSARPGHSEHQTGLTFDLNSLSTSFEDTPEYKWLITNCADFGFILRYPKDGTWATGYSFEPWHYRYIGDTALAKKIMDSGKPLEEYAGLTGENDFTKYKD